MQPLGRPSRKGRQRYSAFVDSRALAPLIPQVQTCHAATRDMDSGTAPPPSVSTHFPDRACLIVVSDFDGFL